MIKKITNIEYKVTLEELKEICGTKGTITYMSSYNDIEPNSPTNGKLSGLLIRVQESESVQETNI